MMRSSQILREYIRCLVKEAADAETIPAHMSAAEKELAAKHPTWGSKEKLKHASPVEVKAKQVQKSLQASGRLNSAESQKKVTQGLVGWLKKRSEDDHQAFFAASPEELADDFESEVLKKA